MCMVGAAEGQKRASYFLENELWVVVRQDEMRVLRTKSRSSSRASALPLQSIFL